MKTEEIKYKTCHCGVRFISHHNSKVCSNACYKNPNTNCKECGCIMPASKKLGTRCYKCDNEKYKNTEYKQYKPTRAEKVKVGKSSLTAHNKYARREVEFTEQSAMEWIEMIIARDEMVSMKELFVDLIDVYYVTKHNDEYEHFTPKKQLEYMWKQCLNWYLKKKKK